MSIKLILLLAFVGLVCYLLGRRARAARADDGRMLQSSTPRAALFDQASRPAGPGTLDAASLEEIKRLIRERQLVAAIKIYRERTHCGLREAKDAVESISSSL